MLKAIKNAIRAIVSTIVNVLTLPFRVLGKLAGGASGSTRKSKGKGRGGRTP